MDRRGGRVLRLHRVAGRHRVDRPGQPFDDPYGTWAQLREISDAGVLLVRPDLYVAARHLGAPGAPEAGVDAETWLRDVFDRVLGTAAATA